MLTFYPQIEQIAQMMRAGQLSLRNLRIMLRWGLSGIDLTSRRYARRESRRKIKAGKGEGVLSMSYPAFPELGGE